MNNMFYELIDENEDFIIINKYPDVSFHSENNEKGLFAKLKEDFNYPLYAVHRLDKITSGLILVAKTSEIASEISKMFSQRKIDKYYIAVSDKKPKKKMGLISGDMKKARNGQWKLTRTFENPAITRFSSFKYEDKYFFILKPNTGKTHQLRVAMKSISSPIIGDVLYGGTNADRGYLHAFRLEFLHKGIKYHYENIPKNGILFNNEYIREKFLDILSEGKTSLKKIERC